MKSGKWERKGVERVDGREGGREEGREGKEGRTWRGRTALRLLGRITTCRKLLLLLLMRQLETRRRATMTERRRRRVA